MKVIERLITVGDTGLLLGLQLGTDRQWVDTLNDMRQERGGIQGADPLLPVARVAGRGPTPRYRPADVLRFIQSVRRLHGCDRPFASPAVKFAFELVDPNEPSAYWRCQRATPVAVP